MIHDKPVESITEADLNALVAAAVMESKTIEYKLELPGQTEGDKREFLYDVSSFANSVGGDILYGVGAKDGVPTAVLGLESSSIDAAKLRLEQLTASGISPRIPGLKFHPVALASGKTLLFVRIPKTWTGPHMVTVQNTNKFYSRHSSGKYLLDVGELRAAFSLGESLGEKIRAFRLNRANAVLNRELTVQLPANGKIILHICPIVSFSPGFQISLDKVYNRRSNELMPMKNTGWGSHFNFDGLLTSSKSNNVEHSYTQVFRNGCLESVESSMLRSRDGQNFIPSGAFENEIVDNGERFLTLLENIGVEPPYVTMLTLLGVRGFTMYAGERLEHRSVAQHPIERDNLFLDDIIIESRSESYARMIRPAFDQVWNACGWPQSPNYNQAGDWQ